MKSVFYFNLFSFELVLQRIMSTPTSNDDGSHKSQRKSRAHTLTRVRNNQRRCRERRRQYIAALEQRVEETGRLLEEARAEIDCLKSQLMECESRRRHHPHHVNQLAEGGSAVSYSGGGRGRGGSIDAAAWMMPLGQQGGYRQVSGQIEEVGELPALLPGPLPAPPEKEDDWPATTSHQQTSDIGYNATPNMLALQQLDNTHPRRPSSSSLALANQRETAVCGSKPPNAVNSDTTLTTSTNAPSPLSTLWTPTLTALQLEGLILPDIPDTSNSEYTVSPADESTTPCSQAFIIISQQNFKGVDASSIERWLCRGFRQATDPIEGCRVENTLLLQLLDFISGP
ncbi:Trappc4 protein, sybindin-like family protein [Histoplasma ohiense]|nr:Trappc4 protein, sybindin-like family protein [Histoplasma ohiense (nom. inval.)]